MADVRPSDKYGASRLKTEVARTQTSWHLTAKSDGFRKSPLSSVLPPPAVVYNGEPSAALACRMSSASCAHVLLSTHNGATYLREQLDSLVAQTHDNWILYWRDDGSSDATIAVLAEFGSKLDAKRCIHVSEPVGRLWPAASFLALLRAVLPTVGPTDTIAFIDQDDVWLPDKLARGMAALADADTAALYCARLTVVDAELRHLTETVINPAICGFPASLTQNIATGCTIMMNRRAAALVANSKRPTASLHDWWCYLAITAAGGCIIVDDARVALYRQHNHNFIGLRLSATRRALAAVRRGPGIFMEVLRQHLEALIDQPELTTEATRQIVIDLHHALKGGPLQRLRSLGLPGLRRQSWMQTLLFRLWFLIG